MGVIGTRSGRRGGSHRKAACFRGGVIWTRIRPRGQRDTGTRETYLLWEGMIFALTRRLSIATNGTGSIRQFVSKATGLKLPSGLLAISPLGGVAYRAIGSSRRSGGA